MTYIFKTILYKIIDAENINYTYDPVTHLCIKQDIFLSWISAYDDASISMVFELIASYLANMESGI